jgi:hypothetical protein
MHKLKVVARILGVFAASAAVSFSLCLPAPGQSATPRTVNGHGCAQEWNENILTISGGIYALKRSLVYPKIVTCSVPIGGDYLTSNLSWGWFDLEIRNSTSVLIGAVKYTWAGSAATDYTWVSYPTNGLKDQGLPLVNVRANADTWDHLNLYAANMNSHTALSELRAVGVQ